MNAARPPRLARALLRRLLPQEDCHEAVDALDERFDELVARGRASWRMHLWYWRQVVGLLDPRIWRPGIVLPGERRSSMMNSWSHDIRFGLRILLKSPGMTAVIIATMAIGLGFNGAVYSLLNTITGIELPVEEPDRVRFVVGQNLSMGRSKMLVSYADFADFRDGATSFESLAASSGQNFNIADADGPPERLVGAHVTPEIFDVLRVEPALGRRLTAADARPGAEPVALLAERIWQRRYASDPALIGSTVRLQGQERTIVGLIPDALQRSPLLTEVWVPLVVTEEALANRQQRGMMVVGRLAPGADPLVADMEVRSIASRLEETYPESNEGVGARAMTYAERFTDAPNRVISFVMFGAVLFLLLIACANVANLLVSRAIHRGREISLRTALGAGRGRILRQVLVESLMLSVAGGVLGMAVAVWGAGALERGLAAAAPPPWWDFSVQPGVFILIGVMSLLTGLLFGTAPALHALRTDVTENLKEGGRSSGGTRALRITGGLVVVQVALALVLLTGAGLMTRSAINVQRVDWGMDTDLLTMRLRLDVDRYPEPENRIAFHRELAASLGAIPGIDAVAAASNFPAETAFTMAAEIEDRPIAAGNSAQAVSQVIVSPSYFDLAGVEPLRGRFFTDNDDGEGEPVVVVEQRFADRFWPGEEPIGKRVRWVGDSETRWMRVVGIAPKILQSLPMQFLDDHPVIYTVYAVEPLSTMGLMVRSPIDRGTLAATLREEVQRLDPNLPLFSIEPLEQILGEATFGWRVSSAIFGVLGLVALLLSCLGIYAVMAFAIGRRQQEIGVRMALGARAREVVGLVVRSGMRQALLGLVLGVLGALATTRAIAIFMYEVSPNDPLTLGATMLLLLVTALLACGLPALRASRVDPMLALRPE